MPHIPEHHEPPELASALADLGEALAEAASLKRSVPGSATVLTEIRKSGLVAGE